MIYKPNYKNWARQISIGFVSVFLLTTAFFAGIYTDAKLTENPNNVQGISVVLNSSKGQPNNVDFTTFWKVWQTLDENYVYTGTSSATTTSEDRVNGAIKGMVASLGDPYTVYFPPEENKNFQTELSGSIEGVGIVIGVKDSKLVVISPVKGSPADRAGVLAGDKIVSIDGKDTTTFSADEAVKMIRGAKGTKVALGLSRNGQNIDVTMIRETITVPAVETKKINNQIFYIKVNEFDANVTDQFRTALREYINGGYSKLIIDVRNNPGGYLDSAVDMSSWFVPMGKIIVSEDFGSEKNKVEHRSNGYGLFNNLNGKIVILANEGSASASEIFAGALQEYKIAKIVGAQTFGKGSVQELIPVTNDTSLKVTIARWLTPFGKSISKEGLTPDVVVPMTDKDYAAGIDPQLQKAQDILNLSY
ncbi:MAG: S41 family peptidase [Candidatus Paceibacterota bacterium]